MRGVFDKFYDEAKQHDGSDLEANIGIGAVWIHRDGRALRMDTITHQRLTSEQVTMLRAEGLIVRDDTPLSNDVDIWIAPREAVQP